MNNMKIIFIFLLLIYWSFIISAHVVSKELKTSGSRIINSKIFLISKVKG